MLPHCICPGVTNNLNDNFIKESLYNSRVLVQNWFEDRRQYHSECPRCTGHSITKTDFLSPESGDKNSKNPCFPPYKFEAQSRANGVGSKLLLNDTNYCSYLDNYLTTYDLMHNWELKRAGCKPKPNRKWKLIHGGIWKPEPDNALAYGNLTTIGFRQAPQLPMVPNDWHTYEKDTSYKRHYVKKNYPDDYVLCRYASEKCMHQGTEDMSLIPRTGVCDFCRFNSGGVDACCNCPCHSSRTPTLIPTHVLKSKPARQSLVPRGIRKIVPVMKREGEGSVPRGYPLLNSITHHPCDNKEYCEWVGEREKFRQGPSLTIDEKVC